MRWRGSDAPSPLLRLLEPDWPELGERGLAWYMAVMSEEPKLGKNTGNAGKGRPKGVPNKNTAALRDMILQALTDQGGAEYLYRQADENPGAFMSLLGKVLPMQVTGEDGGPIAVTRIELVAAPDQ